MKAILNANEASKILGCDPQRIRERLKRGTWKFGVAIPPEETGLTQWTYEINTVKLFEFMGSKYEQETKEKEDD